MIASRDDRGVAILLVAIAMVAILAIAALVVDASQLRRDRRVNKSNADFSSLAGANGLRTGPWQAVCDAHRYLMANTSAFSSFDSGEWTDVAPSASSYSTAPNSCPAANVAPYNAPCTADPSTWAKFRGTAAEGRITVEIQSGYQMPDPNFLEDANRGDVGEPCEQVAVIMRESRPPSFSGVVGAGPQTTKVRSVARLTRGPGDVAALVVLEKTDCRAIDATTNGGKIVVKAVDDNPGVIQVDSNGSASEVGDNCQGGKKVLEGSALPNSGGANVIGESTSTSPVKSGRIGIFALRDFPTRAHTEACPPPGTSPATCTISPRPSLRSPLGRRTLDERYLAGVSDLRTRAKALLASPPGTFQRLTTLIPGINCNNYSGTDTISASNVYIDCDLKMTGGSLTFTAPRSQILTSGTLSVASSATLDIRNPIAVYVNGATGGNSDGLNAVGFDVAGTLLINANGYSSCDIRSDAAQGGNPNEVTELVVGKGGFSAGAQGTVRMCSTMLFMMSGTLGTLDAPPPVNNSFNGWATVGGQGAVDWSAPNRVSGRATQADWDDLEDLAMWTETTQGSTIGGGGVVTLKGVFALPNSNPFTLTGSGALPIEADAQFWTRKLRLAGQGTLEMQPNPDDSIRVFITALVR